MIESSRTPLQDGLHPQNARLQPLAWAPLPLPPGPAEEEGKPGDTQTVAHCLAGPKGVPTQDRNILTSSGL